MTISISSLPDNMNHKQTAMRMLHCASEQTSRQRTQYMEVILCPSLSPMTY